MTAVQLCEQTINPEIFLGNDDWAIEQKLDGHRVMVKVEGGVVSPLNRNGEARSGTWPRDLRATFETLPGNWIFDGELVGYTYWVFDLLAVPGIDSTVMMPWIERRALLDQLFATAVTLPACLRTTSWYRGPNDKAEMYRQCLGANVEGVVFKNVHSPYKVGRSPNWLKCKFVKTCEAVVTEINRKGKQEAMSLGLFDGNGQLQEAGGCRILPKFLGKINVGDVVEVRYLYGTEDFKLYQPHLIRIRDDKTASECTQDQLSIVNKNVLTPAIGATNLKISN